MFNIHLATIDIIVVWINIIGILYATYWNARALKEGTFSRNAMAVLVLLGLYLFGQFLLLLTDIGPGQWSGIFRGLAPLAWYWAWAGPAKVWVKSHDGIKNDLANKLESEIVGRLGFKKEED